MFGERDDNVAQEKVDVLAARRKATGHDAERILAGPHHVVLDTPGPTCDSEGIEVVRLFP